VNVPIRLVGDENNPANVVVEMSGTVTWKAAGGWMEGVTFRRPQMSTGDPTSSPILSISGQGKIDMIQCVFDNTGGSTGPAVVISGPGNKGSWETTMIKGAAGGLVTIDGAVLNLTEVRISVRLLRMTTVLR